MAEKQLLDGPYLRWLRSVRAQVGERSWDLIISLKCEQADAILKLLSVVPWEHSPERYYLLKTSGASEEGVALRLRTVKSQGEREPAEPAEASPGPGGRRSYPDPPLPVDPGD